MSTTDPTPSQPMDPARYRNLKRLCDQALLRVPDERMAWLDEACGNDAALHAEARRLIEACDDDDFMRIPDRNAVCDALEHADRDQWIGSVVGAYRISRFIAAGGLGHVYLAHRADGRLPHPVAIKVLKRGMDTDDILRRFRQEQRTLARLQHPGIATIHDAGTTSDGRPYFVMEHVAGPILTTWCRQHDLTLSQRLELFVQLCDTVQFAHRNGVIHRDLKPANILVTHRDQRPTPVIIDFGIAKAIDAKTRGDARLTRAAGPIGTPQYMSPEQADPAGRPVDTRSDVYSLGVILFELLTGELPARSGTHPTWAAHQHPDTPLPSTRLADSTTVERPHGASAVRRRDVRGDLDWITRKAMAFEPDERYDSATALAEDLRRHQRHRPVEARPPSAAYRARRWVRRHRAVSVLLVLLTFTIGAGTAGTALGLWEARREAVRASQAEDVARAIHAFLSDALSASDPYVSAKPHAQLTVRELLERAAARVPRELEHQPQVAAAVHHTIGRSYAGLGVYDAALRHQQAALRLAPPSHKPEIRCDLAGLLHRQGRDQSAIEHYEVALAELDEHDDGPSVARSRAATGLADVLSTTGAWDAAEDHYRRALREAEIAKAASPDLVPHIRVRLALLLRGQGHFVEAEALLLEALATRRESEPIRPLAVAETLRHLGFVNADLGRLDQAATHLETALQWHHDHLDRGHAQTARVLNDLAMVEKTRGRFARAETLYREAIDIQQQALGAEHREVGIARNNLAATLLAQERAAEAIEQYELAIDIAGTAFGPQHQHTASFKHNLGTALLAQGALDEARVQLEQARALRTDALGPRHPHVAISLLRLAELEIASASPQVAESLARQAISIRRQTLESKHWAHAEAQAVLAAALAAQQRAAEALPLARAALAELIERLGSEHRRTHKVIRQVIAMYDQIGDHAGAARHRQLLHGR